MPVAVVCRHPSGLDDMVDDCSEDGSDNNPVCMRTRAC